MIYTSSLGVVMLAGEKLSSYIPDVGIQETMSEHGEAPLWKIKYYLFFFCYVS
jgi:hypothetical protein